MGAVTDQTAAGTPVGSAKGIVHLLHQATSSRVWGLCGSQLRGNLVERTGEDITCQACIDEADWAAAKAAGFDHEVYARRVKTGQSNIAGPSGMRYGAEVRCWASGQGATIWTTNESGQLHRAKQIAREHYLTAWREHLAAQAEQH